MSTHSTPRPSPQLSKDTSTSSPYFDPTRPRSRGQGGRGSPHPTTTGYINADLANALRDSVIVNPSPTRSSFNPSTTAILSNSHSHHSFIGQEVHHALPPQPIDFSASPSVPSKEFPGLDSTAGPVGLFPVDQAEYHEGAPALPPKSSPSQNHRIPSSSSAYPLDQPRQRKVSSQSDYRMSMAQQPQLPSQRIISSNNPFEQDEIEPPLISTRKGSTGPGGGGGTGNAARVRYTRAQTALAGGTANAPSPHRTRQRRSMSSGSYDAQGRELTAGQRRAAEDKKGSRHADVIDTWDPTGLGSAMWHHQGPYDAAAPSRNVNVPPVRAPMQVFRAPDQAVISPPRAAATVTHAPAPAAPPKETAEAAPERTSRRTQAAMRTGAARRQSGGLTGQYSTSVPASGGYFPDQDQPNDEASMLRRERQAQRDQKRRALKAAWGIDTPEPFEDFGGSPGEEGTINLADDAYPADAPAPRVRSPGLRLGLGPRTPPIKDELSPVSEKGASFNIPASGSVPAYGPGGVKRTKSLMQKIKGIRDGPRVPNRAHSPNSASLSSPQDVTNPQLDNTGYVKRPMFFSRNSGKSSPQKTSPLNATPDEPIGDEDIPEETGSIPSDSTGSGFVLVESPNSKARAMRALQKEREDAARKAAAASGMLENFGVPSAQSEPMLSQSDQPRMPPSDTMASLTYGVPPMNRVKGLPTPPIGPVIPDFDDLVISRTRSRQRAISTSDSQRELAVPEDGAGVRRKTSVVKKIKEKIK